MMASWLAFFLLATAFWEGRGAKICDFFHSGRQFGDYCYYTSNEQTPSYEAGEIECNKEAGGSLVSIHSQEENDFVATYVLSIDPSAYIGLHNSEGALQWTDGTPVDYDNFAPGALDRPAECFILLQDKTWQNVKCDGGSSLSLCKKKAMEIPETPRDACPADNVFSDYGTIFSPGFPKYYWFGDGSYGVVCRYYFKGKEGYRVVFELLHADMQRSDFLKAYEGWTADDAHLLSKPAYPYENKVISTKSSNLMVVDFYITRGGAYEIAFYTEPINPVTQNPSFPTTTPASSPNCPAQNTFKSGGTIASPNFPFAYGVNTHCVYYFLNDDQSSEHKTGLLQIEVVEMDIGADDYIDFIDLRTNAVFQSSKGSVLEGFEILADFPVGVSFVSGNTQEMFGRWRIEVSLTF